MLLFVAGAVFGEVQVSLFVAGALFGEVEVLLSWQAQYLVKFNCHFSWQAQYSLKFGMIAGARNVVFFNTNCSGCGLTVSCSDHSRIMLGSWSDRPRIGNDVSSVFSKFP